MFNSSLLKTVLIMSHRFDICLFHFYSYFFNFFSVDIGLEYLRDKTEEMLLLPRPRSSMNTVRPSTSTFAEKNKNRVRPLTSYPETHVLERACTELNSHVRREMKNNISSEKSEKMRLLKLMRLDSFIIKKGKKERILN